MKNQSSNIIYPKSINKKQCLGPCYYPKTSIIHPTTLTVVTNTDPFCPVDQWTFKNDSGEEIEQITDKCLEPTENKNINSDEIEINILTPYFDFNSGQFLKIYYNIFSFDDAINWMENNKTEPILTKIRIINSSLITFGQEIDIFDSRLVDFIIEVIKKKKINQIYEKIHNYISFDKDNIFLKKNNINKKEKYVERINYLSQMFVNKDEITKFLIDYFSQNKKIWENIENHIELITIHLIEYILNKINNIL
jgi:hypothetical protein